MSEPLVPARIVNEHVYCPRLAWLEWEARAFQESSDTAEGTDAHRRVNRETGTLTDDPGQAEETATSVTLSSERLGIVAKLDKVERADGVAVPVETKRGRPRKGDLPVWEPELAQLAAQVLLLREQGYDVPHAEVFFAETRVRRAIPVGDDAERWLRRIVAEIRANATRSTPPPPLVDSPKCPRCSLVGVCLPDETNLLRERADERPRRLVASDDPAQPLYLTTPGGFVRKRGGRLVLEHEGEEVASRRMIDIAHLAVFGNVTLSSGALRACLEQDVPVLWFSAGGWFSGYAIAHGGSWVARRVAQHRVAVDGSGASMASAFIAGKVRNQRTLLRRLGGEAGAEAVGRLGRLTKRVEACRSPEELLGLEGTAARWYFERFGGLLRNGGEEFAMDGRNRRPPTDPVNAMLSFAYALLVRDATVAVLAAGLDPQVGFFHRPRHGRPSLALDLAEEFRPLVADSTVVMAVNNGELQERHFVRRGGAVALTAAGRKRMIGAYERRVAVTTTHPLFGYKTTYRRAIELQARQLAAVVEGQLAVYRPLVTR